MIISLLEKRSIFDSLGEKSSNVAVPFVLFVGTGFLKHLLCNVLHSFYGSM